MKVYEKQNMHMILKTILFPIAKIYQKFDHS